MFRPLGAALLVFAIQATFTAYLAPLVGAAATLFGYASCFLTYAAILFLIRREAPTTALALGIAGAAVAVRLALVWAHPVLSDDIFRYVWEGRVTLAGFNPFVDAPASETLAALRDAEIWPNVNHPEIPAIYPPYAQFLFAAVAAVGGGTTLTRLALLAVEAACVVGVWHFYKDHPRRVFGLAIYALNPLVLLEVAWSGHLDVLAWGPLVVALVVLVRRTGVGANFGAGALLGLSIGAKLLGVILLPYLLLRRRADDESWRAALANRSAMLLATTLIVSSGYAVFADAGPKLFGGFGNYAVSWRSNDGIFRAWDSLSWVALQNGEPQERIFEFSRWNDAALEHGFTKEWEGQTLPNTSFATNQISQTVAKGLAAFAVGLVLLFCILAVRDPLVATLAILLTLYLVAPTVHPWYVAWLVPLTALRPNATSLAFSACVLAGYVAWLSYAAGGAWLIPWWVVAAEYSAVFAVLLWEVGRRP